MNMFTWKDDIISADKKLPMPILSFPATQLLGISVSQLINDSNLQAAGMSAVADRWPSLASVSLMDLSVEAEAFGAEIRFSDIEVPTVIGKIINSLADAENLKVPQLGSARTGIYLEAVAKACRQIKDRPIFAGTIGPLSLAGRLIGMTELMISCYTDPQMLHATLEKATTFLLDYIREYKNLGANGVAIAEPAAGLLSAQLMNEFSGKYVQQIVEKLQEDGFAVIYHNCGNSTIHAVEEILKIGAIGYHFGDAINMKAMLEKMSSDVLVMGNISPAEVFHGGTVDLVREKTKDLLQECSVHQNFIISSGCDIPPDTSWRNLDAFFTTVADFYL